MRMYLFPLQNLLQLSTISSLLQIANGMLIELFDLCRSQFLAKHDQLIDQADLVEPQHDRRFLRIPC